MTEANGFGETSIHPDISTYGYLHFIDATDKKKESFK